MKKRIRNSLLILGILIAAVFSAVQVQAQDIRYAKNITVMYNPASTELYGVESYWVMLPGLSQSQDMKVSSSNTQVATVEYSLGEYSHSIGIHPKKPGNTVVSATYTPEGKNARVTYKMNVTVIQYVNPFNLNSRV